MFSDSLGFITRNLGKIQAGRRINSPGKLEIPRIVFEELLASALVHRDYFISAPIRVFVFSNRVEIINPRNLPNHLTVEKIRSENSIIRNPILVSFIAKGLLPYRRLGSGIIRAIENWPLIDLADDREGCIFKATIQRKTVLKRHNKKKKQNVGLENAPTNAPINAPITELQKQILDAIRINPALSYSQLADLFDKNRTTIVRHINKLKAVDKLRRIGSKKSGYWHVNQ